MIDGLPVYGFMQINISLVQLFAATSREISKKSFTFNRTASSPFPPLLDSDAQERHLRRVDHLDQSQEDDRSRCLPLVSCFQRILCHKNDPRGYAVYVYQHHYPRSN